MPERAAPEGLTRDDVGALVHAFYAAVRADPLLGPVFEQALQGRWDAHLERLVDFWSTLLLGTRSFRGDLRGRHQPLAGITPAHFAQWTRLWQTHTERMLPAAMARQAQLAAHGIARQLFRDRFGRPPPFARGPEPHELVRGH